MNRLLILLLLIGLLYVIYKYQHLIFTAERFNSIENLIYQRQPTINSVAAVAVTAVTADNISQISIDNDIEDKEYVYKPDSVLDSLDGSLFISDAGSKSNNSVASDNSSFFF